MENPEADSSNIHQDQEDYDVQIQYNVQVPYDDNSNDPAYCNPHPQPDQSYQPLQSGDNNGPKPPRQQQQFQPPQQQMAPNPPAGAVPGQWTTGLCGCCEDRSNCVITFCCPCITFGQNVEIIDRGATSCFVGWKRCCFFANSGVACLYSGVYRTKLRGLHSLPGDPCADFLVHCFCMCCALSQEYRELKNRGFDPSIGWAANAQKMNQGAATMPPMKQGMGR